MLFLPSTICWHGLPSKPCSWTSPPGLPNREREMNGYRGQELSPFSLEAIFSGIEILGLIGSMYDSERIGPYDWKLWCALIVDYEITIPVFWLWEMAIDIFNCSRVGGKVRSDVYSPALTCSFLGKMSCRVVLSWSPVMDTHPWLNLSGPRSHWPRWGFHLHCFIRTLSETPIRASAFFLS